MMTEETALENSHTNLGILDGEIEARFHKAVLELLKNDPYLLIYNVCERAITHKLGEYLGDLFSDIPNLSVDCEYNKNLLENKILKQKASEARESIVAKVREKAELLEPDELLELSTYPDIVVHKRGHNYPTNILIVEAKKENSQDRSRLEACCVYES